MGEDLPYGSNLATLDQLTRLPAGQPISFRNFAGRLIQATGLKWGGQDMTGARDSLYSAIERMVIDILVDFNGVKRAEKDTSIGEYRYKKLESFTITRLGRGLLKAIAED
jgi:hypothetical protein